MVAVKFLILEISLNINLLHQLIVFGIQIAQNESKERILNNI